MTDNNLQAGPAAQKTTIRDMLTKHNIKSSTLRMRFPKMGLSNYDINRELTPNEIAIIVETYGHESAKASDKKPRAITTAPSAPPRQRKVKQKWYEQLQLLDLIIWGEILLGWFSLYKLASVAGLGFGLVAVVFYEFSRQTMHKPYRMLTEGYTQAEYNAAQEYNTMLQTQKAIALRLCILIACVLCFANWHSFNAAIEQSTELELQLLSQNITGAHVLATVFALLMSGIAYVCLRAISLNKQMNEANNE